MTESYEVPDNRSTATTVVRRPSQSFVGKIFGFITWILGGFGLVQHIFRGTSGANPEEVILYSVHQSFFLWALLLVGFLGAPLQRHGVGSPLMWGWLYLWVLLYTLVTLLFDINTPKFLLWVGIFSFLLLGARYLEEVKLVPVLTKTLQYFTSQKPLLDPGFATVVSWLLLPAWISSLFRTFGRGRKTFTPNSIEEWYVGEGCEITDRSGLKFRTRYRDIFETILGMGAGDLEAIDGQGRVVKRWSNILFLMFTWSKLDSILHQRAATVDNSRLSPVEVEDVSKT